MIRQYQALKHVKAEARAGSLIASAQVRKASHVQSRREKCEEETL